MLLKLQEKEVHACSITVFMLYINSMLCLVKNMFYYLLLSFNTLMLFV